MMASDNKYNLTFTAGALLVNETCAVAEAYLKSGRDWKFTRDRVFKENLMEKEKLSTNQRIFALVKQRINSLTDFEQEMLVKGSISIKRLLLLVAICKAHTLVYDFISINVRDSFFNLDEKVTYAHFNEFFNEKKYIHPELESITDATVAKIRQVIFRILEQSELIESIDTGLLHRPYVPEELERILVKDDPRLLSIFLYSNNEILNATNLYE